jgi:hypothetical protein
MTQSTAKSTGRPRTTKERSAVGAKARSVVRKELVMSCDEIIDRTKKTIEDYNRKRPTEGAKTPTETFLLWLKENHTDAEALSLLGCSDVENRGLPKALAREIVLFWREAERHRREEVIVVVVNGPDAEAAGLGPKALVERYDPDDPGNAYGTRLATIAGKDSNGNGNKFIIFNGDAVDWPHTKDELRRLVEGYPSRDIAIHGGMPYETFAVGNRPTRYTDQSPWDWLEPLYHGESNAGAAWGHLPLETRQLVFIATQIVKEPDIQKYTEFGLFSLLERQENKEKDSSFELTGKLFPRSFVQYSEYQRQKHLPAMKVAVGTNSAGPSSNP